jgi:hypothetical protein
MDPMTAIGLTSAIVQFIDYSTRLVDAASDIHRSASGTSLENQNIEFVMSELKALSLRLDPPRTGQPTDDEQALCRLAAECRILSDQILSLLEKIKPRNPKSKRESFWSAIKTMWNDREMKELVQRVQNCRSQLELQLNFLMRFFSPFPISTSMRFNRTIGTTRKQYWKLLHKTQKETPPDFNYFRNTLASFAMELP